LKKLIKEDGLRGITSNPKIFDNVIAGSHDYDGRTSDRTPNHQYRSPGNARCLSRPR
jgi:transaldolase